MQFGPHLACPGHAEQQRQLVPQLQPDFPGHEEQHRQSAPHVQPDPSRRQPEQHRQLAPHLQPEFDPEGGGCDPEAAGSAFPPQQGDDIFAFQVAEELREVFFVADPAIRSDFEFFRVGKVILWSVRLPLICLNFPNECKEKWRECKTRL